MPLWGTMEEGTGAHLDNGTYLVRCTGIIEAEIENSQYDPRIYRISLETADYFDEDGQPVKLDAIASRKLSPNSKMTRWLAAFNVPFIVGNRIDLEQIIGKSCMATILNKQTERGEFSRVEELVAAPRSRAAASPAPVAPQETRQEPSTDAQPTVGHYHPAAATEPIVDAAPASQAALDYIDRLLSDVGIDGRELRSELDLLPPPHELTADEARRAVKWLEERKTGTRAPAPA
jgi:hypothetical protein